MRILIIDKEFPPHPHGGIGAYNLSLARALGQAGHAVRVVTWAEVSRTVVTEEDFGPVIGIPFRPSHWRLRSVFRWLDELRFGLAVSRHLPGILSTFPADLIETASSGGAAFAFLKRKWTGPTPVVVRFHGSVGKEVAEEEALRRYREEYRSVHGNNGSQAARWVNQPLWKMEETTVRRADFISFPSLYARNWLGGQMNRSLIHHPVIPNGIAIPEIRHREGNNGGVTVSFVGRCSVAKGCSVLLKAIPLVLEKFPKTFFQVIGPLVDPTIEAQVRALCAQHPGNLAVTGRISREQVMERLFRSDLYVHPSFFEISPMSMLEAMALELPILAANTGPMPEIITHEEQGLLVEAGDSTDLAGAICRLIDLGPVGRGILGRRGRQKVEETHEIGKIREQLIEYYTGLM